MQRKCCSIAAWIAPPKISDDDLNSGCAPITYAKKYFSGQRWYVLIAECER
jgi:hypothetical protein